VVHSLHPADITFHMICSSLQPTMVLNCRVHLPLLSMLQGNKWGIHNLQWISISLIMCFRHEDWQLLHTLRNPWDNMVVLALLRLCGLLLPQNHAQPMTTSKGITSMILNSLTPKQMIRFQIHKPWPKIKSGLELKKLQQVITKCSNCWRRP
jgi:hypothetical protein